MRKPLFSAAGYLSILLVPALLVLGITLDVPSLAFATVMLVFPLARSVFGHLRPDDGMLWSENLATALETLPLVYAVALPAAIGLVLRHLAIHGVGPGLNAVALALSLWITMLLSTCVAHELVHRRNARHAMVGHCLAGFAGYAVLAQEHLAHHARSGDTLNAEWPRVDESVWRFAFRRATRIFREVYAPGAAFWSRRAHSRNLRGVRVGTAVSLMTWGFFAGAAGWEGVAIYLGVAVGVTFGVQLINYIQHWGLGNDRLGDRASRGYAWEDDCRFQAWLTLSISLHQAHHDASRRPYYRVALRPDSPRLPAGYVILMVICLIPQLWHRLMLPALEHWEQMPADPRSPGRRLTCFALYGRTPTSSVSR